MRADLLLDLSVFHLQLVIIGAGRPQPRQNGEGLVSPIFRCQPSRSVVDEERCDERSSDRYQRNSNNQAILSTRGLHGDIGGIVDEEAWWQMMRQHVPKGK